MGAKYSKGVRERFSHDSNTILRTFRFCPQSRSVLCISQLSPQGEIEKSAPGGGFVLSSGRLTRGVKSHRSPKSGCWKQLFTLLDFRPENQILVITMSTISMCQNCSTSFSADPGGAKQKFAHLGRPQYNYDMQSSNTQATTETVRGPHTAPPLTRFDFDGRRRQAG